jgi:predicted aldo/keto reductase-like oxidoreductase
MQYRKFGKTDWQASALGFGSMRLPLIGDNTEIIDEPLAIEMIRHGIDAGINYVDTAYGYHGGKSEVVVGKALKDGYRDKVKLATKLPPWFVKAPADMDTRLNEQLTRLDTDYIDLYLIHALNKDSWVKMRDFGVIEWAHEQIRKGKIRYLGFSFHDDAPTFKTIIDAYDQWTFCQIQNSYLDEQVQAGTEGLKYAGAKGIAVVVMEPLRGGRLANPSEKITRVWDSFPVKKNPVEWALDYIWNQPEVSVILSGMSTMQQLEDNLQYADRSAANKLTPEELTLIEQVRDTYNSLVRVDCTTCRYCMPCPENVDIPGMFSIYNEAAMFDSWDDRKKAYQWYTGKKSSADFCVECGVCEEKCPQDIPIPQRLKEVKEHLETPNPDTK